MRYLSVKTIHFPVKATGDLHRGDRRRIVAKIEAYAKTGAGEILVVLPLAEYEALVESSDIAAHKKAMASLARGETELPTAEETMARVEAPRPLKFWRKKRGPTQSALAASAGISQNYLSELEKGGRKGDPALFKKLAKLLKVPIEALIED